MAVTKKRAPRKTKKRIPRKPQPAHDVSELNKAPQYYTRTEEGPAPVGYEKADANTPANTWDLASIYYATSTDTYNWEEQGLAVPRGPVGQFDERSVFTPGVLVWKGRYYLYYQAVANPFNRRTRNVIGMSWADSPDGPWHRHPEPVLEPGKPGVWRGDKDDRSAIIEEGDFDSLKVHDPFLIVRGGRIFLYYKAHPMGLAGDTPLSYPNFSGGLAIGLSSAGLRHAAVLEWDKYACDTVRENQSNSSSIA